MNYKEAFCLMHYSCDECGHDETLWNSRDGVTPFVIPCSNCKHIKMRHYNFHEDVERPFYTPYKGQRYFTDMTEERAWEFADKNVDDLINKGYLPENERNRVAGELFKSYFGDGYRPDILTMEDL